MRKPKPRRVKAPELTIAERLDLKARKKAIARIARETGRKPQTVERWLRGGKDVPKHAQQSVAKVYARAVGKRTGIPLTKRERAQLPAQRALAAAERERLDVSIKDYARREGISERSAHDFSSLTLEKLDRLMLARDVLLGPTLAPLEMRGDPDRRREIENAIDRLGRGDLQKVADMFGVTTRQVRTALFSPVARKIGRK